MISLIIPVHNDAYKLLIWWEELKSILSKIGKYEIIIAEDGSNRRNYEICKKLSKEKNVKLSHHKKKLGKGLAIRKAFEISNGDIIGYVDADGSTEPIYIIEAAKLLRKYDVVIGSRYLGKAQRKLYRMVPSIVYNVFANMLLGTNIIDHQCGFKFFKRNALEKISGESVMNHFSWDTEIIYLARKKNFKIKEIPVEWKEETSTTVRILDSAKMLLNLFLIKSVHN